MSRISAKTDPLQNGFVTYNPFNENQQPTMKSRIKQYLQKFENDEQNSNGKPDQKAHEQIFNQSPKTAALISNNIKTIVQKKRSVTIVPQISSGQLLKPRTAPEEDVKRSRITNLKVNTNFEADVSQLGNCEFGDLNSGNNISQVQFNEDEGNEGHSPQFLADQKNLGKTPIRNYSIKRRKNELQTPSISTEKTKDFKKKLKNMSKKQAQADSAFAYLSKTLRELSAYKKQSQNDSDWPVLTENAEKIFRMIAEQSNSQVDLTQSIRTLKIDKKKLTKYLQDKYQTRTAKKLVSMFDFTMPLNYKEFFLKLQNIFINHELTSEELCDSAKNFAFNIYDMNCDGFIESNDLFSFIKDVNSDDVLNQACYQDIQDIQFAIEHKQKAIEKSDPAIDFQEGQYVIKDIEKYFNSQTQKRENRANFIQIFVPEINSKQSNQCSFQIQKTLDKSSTTLKSAIQIQNGSSKKFDKVKGIPNFLSNINQDAHIQQQQGRRNSLSNIITQASKLYGNERKFAKIKTEEISQIMFQSAYPMIYLHFLDTMFGTDIIRNLYLQFKSDDYVYLCQPDSQEMQTLRTKVDERFLNIIFMLFDKLGALDSSLTATMKNQEKESWQYITFNSLYSKMHSVFGIKNLFFAKIFFLYLGNRRPLTAYINFQMFFQKLMPFWMKAPNDMIYSSNSQLVEIFLQQARNQRIAEMNSAVFDILNIKGDKAIGIVTITELCSQFPIETGIGQEVHKMLQLYSTDLKEKIKRSMLQFDKHNYQKYFPDPCLVKDLDRIFCAQFIKDIQYVQVPQGFKNENSTEPIARLTCIQDETNAPPQYFEQLVKNREFYKLDEIYKEFGLKQ